MVKEEMKEDARKRKQHFPRGAMRRSIQIIGKGMEESMMDAWMDGFTNESGDT